MKKKMRKGTHSCFECECIPVVDVVAQGLSGYLTMGTPTLMTTVAHHSSTSTFAIRIAQR
jgi:hypothetical protein